VSRLPSPAPPLFRAVVAPLQHFFRLEAASGILLLLSAAVALGWANSPWAESYARVFDYPLALGAGGSVATFSVRLLINDGLMALFFFVVGMEIKRELVVGELRTLSRAALPAVAAMGGMVVPAGLYALLNRGGDGMAGWAIPMATDIAFCIGLLTLLKGRVPNALVVFITALAIFDDMGGILVIALFYGTGLHVQWLMGAAALVGLAVVLGRLRVRSGLAWAVLGLALWYTVHHGGIHATIAGVILGLCIPARSGRPSLEVLRGLHAHTGAVVARAAMRPDEAVEAAELLSIEERLEDLEPPLNRFIHALHPYVAFLVMPVFALANSGVSLAGVGLSQLGSPIPLGAALGLFVGKQLGIFGATVVAVKLGLSAVPGGASLRQLYGISVLAGIGFTVALFIAGLAFPDAARLDAAKLGILVGSLASGVVGFALLRVLPAPRANAEASDRASGATNAAAEAGRGMGATAE
jgi:NhaA family Na+:H+ antiporter